MQAKDARRSPQMADPGRSGARLRLFRSCVRLRWILPAVPVGVVIVRDASCDTILARMILQPPGL